jgi:2-iminoacetate synthase
MFKEFANRPMPTEPATFIDESEINRTLENVGLPDTARVREVLAKSREMRGLSGDEVAVLMNVESPDLLEEMFAAARYIKDEIYGNRLVLFAPLYISNLCKNECTYCAFRRSNKDLTRRTLSMEEIAAETRILINQGHKRMLLVAGESYPEPEGFDYVLKAIEAVYATKSNDGKGGEIRRVNVNVAPLTQDEFIKLKAARIGTYQCFQETYHRPTYTQVHVCGVKRDYDWRVTAPDRAMRAHIDDVGIGVLFGLYDWKFEMLALRQHCEHLEREFNVGPHTISMPRIEPAVGSPMSANPPHRVSDAEFKKIVAITRLSVPYTGMIMTTRETPAMRRATLDMGVSQISAGSRTNPGGYSSQEHNAEQFHNQLGDHRTLDEVVRDIAQQGFIPSLCTACYREGRTGAEIMKFLKPGAPLTTTAKDGEDLIHGLPAGPQRTSFIKKMCTPNALSSYTEYLENYASPETRAAGLKVVKSIMETLEGGTKRASERMVARVLAGEKDVYF